MTTEKTTVGNIKTTIGLATDKTIDQVYVAQSNIETSISTATSNNKVAGAKATKDELDNKISKSQTTGLVKNDGTIDTTTYLSSHQDISGKEDTTNKVSSWSSTTTNTHYPSEKLVKDSLDDKISKSSTTGLVKNDGTIDTTTYLSSHQDITGKEDSSNKVSSWSSTTTNTHYPSEKLVKDSLDDKISKSSTSGLVKNDGTIDTNTYLTSSDITDKIEISVLASAEQLPATGSANVFYFVPSSSTETNDSYDEYVWIGSSYEKVGVQKIDLTSYVKKSEIKDYVSGEIASNGDLKLVFTY